MNMSENRREDVGPVGAIGVAGRDWLPMCNIVKSRPATPIAPTGVGWNRAKVSLGYDNAG